MSYRRRQRYNYSTENQDYFQPTTPTSFIWLLNSKLLERLMECQERVSGGILEGLWNSALIDHADIMASGFYVAFIRGEAMN